jgi:hypothetical protein
MSNRCLSLEQPRALTFRAGALVARSSYRTHTGRRCRQMRPAGRIWRLIDLCAGARLSVRPICHQICRSPVVVLGAARPVCTLVQAGARLRLLSNGGPDRSRWKDIRRYSRLVSDSNLAGARAALLAGAGPRGFPIVLLFHNFLRPPARSTRDRAAASRERESGDSCCMPPTIRRRPQQVSAAHLGQGPPDCSRAARKQDVARQHRSGRAGASRWRARRRRGPAR